MRYLVPRTAGTKPWSLEPTRALLAALGDPQRHFVAIHIGGTNGKGSVATLVHAALREAGRSAALYTSPHLVDVRERMIVDDRPIARDAFAMWTERLRPVIEATGASFFEATTAIAFADFAARGAELAVVEVGLGGRLDSTNVLTPAVSAVTRVALEHTDYLGDSLAGIAREKAGIAKRGVPFVVGEHEPALVAELVATAEAAGAEVRIVPPDAEYTGPLALQGRHQRRNAAIARAVVDALPGDGRPPSAAVERGFARARVPGRFDRRGRWIFDVAHNPDGMRVMLQALRDAAPPRPIHALVGILRDKAWGDMVGALGEGVDRLWLTQPPSAAPDRRWDLAEVAQTVGRSGGRDDARPPTIEPDFDRALQLVQDGAATVLVTGSFHTVGDALARLPGFAPLG